MLNDKITVITVCYNAETVIEKTIISVINQTYKNIEYIVIDGNSKDRTVEIASSIKKNRGREDFKFIILSEEDNGIYDAMNKGIKLATGEWVIFLNADDTFNNDSVLEAIFKNNLYKSIDGIFGDTLRIGDGYEKIVEGNALENIKDKFPLPFCHQSVFVQTTLLKDNFFNVAYKQAADYNLFMQLYLEKKKFIHVNTIVSNYAMGGISETNTILHLKEKIAIRDRAGFKQSKLKSKYMVMRLELRQKFKRIIPRQIFLIYKKCQKL